MPNLFKKSQIHTNQDYLKEWDDYQLEFLNSEKFCLDNPLEHALLLPISVDIKDGIIDRHRIRTPQLKGLLDDAKTLLDDDSTGAIESYVEFFDPIDGQQSGSPSTPLDFDLNTRVYMLFHFPRENWTFTDHTQFSVDNIAKGQLKDAFEVVGTFNEGHSLLVHNKNWQDPKVKGNKPAKVKGKAPSKSFLAKYNLHVSIHQVQDGEDMRTDIIIDPGSRNSRRP